MFCLTCFNQGRKGGCPVCKKGKVKQKKKRLSYQEQRMLEIEKYREKDKDEWYEQMSRNMQKTGSKTTGVDNIDEELKRRGLL